MTNRSTPNAKTLLAAAIAASALLGLSACGSSSAKPSAAAASTPATGISATTVGAPTTNQQSPAANSTAQPSTATANEPSTADPVQNTTQTQPPAPARSTTKPSTKPSTTTASGLAAACTPGHLKGTVTGLTRPINHVLLTVTNTGGTVCNLYYYPDLHFDADQQAVTQAIEDSKPQAVVTIDPGQSAYASIGTSAADSSAGKVEPQVEVFLESRDQSGSLPGSLKLPLPGGTVVDENSAFVTYWQSDMQSAIAW